MAMILWPLKLVPVAYVVNGEQVTYQVLDDLTRQLIGKEADYSRIVARLVGRYGKRPEDAKR